jgi:hypothetical protein
MEPKIITLIIPAAGIQEQPNHRQITLEPGTTAGQLLMKEGLAGYNLSLETGGQFLAEFDDVYSLIADKGKLYATPVAMQG